MENHTSNHLTEYYLEIALDRKQDLAPLRTNPQLKLAFEENTIWVKGFSETEITCLEVRMIPFKTLYRALDGKLFLLNSRLPDRSIPSVLWTPIARALPIQLPSFNHNYFGLQESISLTLEPSLQEQPVVGMFTTSTALLQYVEKAPAIRLERLTWVIVEKQSVFLLGQPILPLEGTVYWRKNDFLIPAGYDFDLTILVEEWSKWMNPAGHYWVVWQQDNTYFLIHKLDLTPLSIGSVRRSFSTTELDNDDGF